MPKANTIGFPAVHCFAMESTLRAQALKVLEEAAELVESTKRYERTMDDRNASMDGLVGAREDLMSEAADVNQALANLLDAIASDSEEAAEAAAKCTARNIRRGRLGFSITCGEGGEDA